MSTESDLDEAMASDRVSALGEQLSSLACRHGLKIATAESLTAGNLAAALGKAPSSGDWYLGGIVAYHPSVKHSLLKVPPGPVVSKASAITMANSTAALMGADLTLAATGEAGPDTQEDVPPGTVWFGVAEPGLTTAASHVFSGEPPEILAATIEHALKVLLDHAYSIAAL